MSLSLQSFSETINSGSGFSVVELHCLRTRLCANASLLHVSLSLHYLIFLPMRTGPRRCACGSAILSTARSVITISWSRPDLASTILRVSHLSLHPADQLGRLNQINSVETNVQCAFVLVYVVSVTGCLIITLLRFLAPYKECA